MRFHDDCAPGLFNFAFEFEYFGTALRHTPPGAWETPMGFIFRSIFWLALALVALPPEARLGGGAGEVDMREVDLGEELHNAAYAAWAFVAETASSCDTNPELCKAAASLWDTTLKTAAGMAGKVDERWEPAVDAPVKFTEAPATGRKKIQARVE